MHHSMQLALLFAVLGACAPAGLRAQTPPPAAAPEPPEPPAGSASNARPVPVPPVQPAPMSESALPLEPAAPAAPTPPVEPALPPAPSRAPAQEPVSEGAPAAAGSDVAADAGEEAGGAQEKLTKPAPAQGHYISLGVHGVGAMARDADRGTRPPTLGGGLSLRLGESMTDWFDIGLRLGLRHTTGDEGMTLGGVLIEGQVRVLPAWYLRAAFGVAGVGGQDPDDPAYDRGAYGTAYMLGVSTNLNLSDPGRSGGWVLSPVLSLLALPDSDFTPFGVSLGLELSWWSGLRRNQLELPFDEAYKSKKRR